MSGCFWLGEFDLDWKRSRDTMYEWWHKDGIAVAVFVDFTDKWHVFVQFEDDRDPPDQAKMQTAFRERTGHQNVQLNNPAWIKKFPGVQPYGPRPCLALGHRKASGEVPPRTFVISA